MKWTNLNGRQVNLNIFKYAIDWEKKAPSKGAQSVKDFFFTHCRYDVWTEELRLPNTRLRTDFINFTKRFAIEFDGIQHNNFSKFYHNDNRLNWLASIKRDDKKDKILEKNNLVVIRIEDSDLPLTKEYFSKNFNIFL